MKINKSIIKKLNPCSDRFDNYIEHYGNKTFTLTEFLSLDSITYDDKVWVVIRLFTKEQNIKWSVLCVESVLHIFEEKYPEDKRPRLAIEATKDYINNPNAANAAAAAAAADAAADAYTADADGADAYAADAAGAYAAYAYGAYAADAYAAGAAGAYAAYAAGAAGAYAAYAAGAEKQQEDINLLMMIEAIT